jgi:LPXTG-motif cell wall-anchored protein
MIIVFSMSQRVSASDELIDIEASPDKVLFSIDNLKPGDWAERKLIIQNRGTNDFTYNTEAIFKKGSKKLYDEFLLKVNDSNQSLYNGKLKDFSGLNPRFLRTLNQEDLLFTVEFPSELGNEYQGLAFEVEFRFIAEEQINGNPDPDPDPETPPSDDNENIEPERPIGEDDLESDPVDGQVLPSTATNMYNFVFLGFILLLLGIGLHFYQLRQKFNKDNK